MTIQIIIAGLVVMLASLSGKLLTYGVARKFVQGNLRFLVTFAMGVFVATLLTIVGEIAQNVTNIATTILLAIGGALVLEVVGRLIPDAHHHHGSDKKECCGADCGGDKSITKSQIAQNLTPTKINPKRILLGDAFHNISDGIILVPAFFISLPTGIAVTLGILLHEAVQETSEFFLLKEAGYSTRRALLSNLAVSSTIFIGIIVSLFVSTATNYSDLLLTLSVGAIGWIILRDLLPHTISRIRHNGQLPTHIIVFLCGLLISQIL